MTRRSLIAGISLAPAIASARYYDPQPRVFDVMHYGAIGDGQSLDTNAFQKAINAAAAAGNGSQVLARGPHKYVVGTLELKSNIDFHLGDGTQLIASIHREDYRGDALLVANGVHDLTISGNGGIDGRAQEYMARFDQEHAQWVPRDWRPKMFALVSCRDLKMRDIGVVNAPYWTIHLLGCDRVEIDSLKIHNMMNVPSSDGIDPDHCRNMVIRRCHIATGDDAIAIKSSRQSRNYGPAQNIIVRDCVIDTQSAGIKIGTETAGDIRDIRVENCEIRSSSRGISIQLRDEGSISSVEFNNIKVMAQYGSDPWWGRGEPISFTAIPRTPTTKLGRIHSVHLKNIAAKGENSVRISGCPASRIRDVTLEAVSVTVDRWTAYPGGFYDNRPTSAQASIERHGTPGFFISYAQDIALKNCSVLWGKNVPDYFSYALEAHRVEHLDIDHLKGHSAHPDRQKTTAIS